MIDPTLIVEAVPALGVIFGAFLYGGRIAGRIDANTKATEKLTASMDKQSEKYDMRLENHEVRITVLESKEKK